MNWYGASWLTSAFVCVDLGATAGVRGLGSGEWGCWGAVDGRVGQDRAAGVGIWV